MGMFGAAASDQRPAATPSSMVPSVGMKLSVRWTCPGKQVQEPDIERLSQVAVHIPVRRKSCEEVLAPAIRHAHGCVVEIGARRRIECPCQPVGEENPSKRGPLPARTNECKQKGKRVSETNLGQRVFEGEVGDGAACRPQEYAQRHQQETAPDGMAKHALKGGALLLTASQ